MSARSRRNTIIGGAFIPHTLEMRRSPAWRALPDIARRVLDRLELEHMEHGGTENGRLICTYDQFAKSGIRRASLPLALRQAIALGFLRVTTPGGRAIADVRQPTRYRLTYPPGLSLLGGWLGPARRDRSHKRLAAYQNSRSGIGSSGSGRSLSRPSHAAAALQKQNTGRGSEFQYRTPKRARLSLKAGRDAEPKTPPSRTRKRAAYLYLG